MRAYYNELDSKVAAWLRELIKSGAILEGDVDERSVEDVCPRDLDGYTQCHFFAGIGGWSYALELARWPRHRSVWTGSCPCQPFSAAGKSKGFADKRHLWPSWFHLIEQCRPPVIFGEQVASPDGLAWFDLVSSDLEAEGFAVGAFDLSAASVGAPHIRQRLYFVGDTIGTRLEGLTGPVHHGDQPEWFDPLARGSATKTDPASGEFLADTTNEDRRRGERGEEAGTWSRALGRQRLASGCAASYWADAEYIACEDGRSRPIESFTFPLAHGVPGRVGLLRGYGNAIVPQVAQVFIEAYLEASTSHAQ